MFCSECGAAVAGKFCSECGAKAVRAANGGAAIALIPTATDSSPDEPLDLVFDDSAGSDIRRTTGFSWEHESSYERLLAHDVVRNRIAAAGERHKPGITGEQYLAVFDALVPTGVSLEKLCVAIQPISARFGFKTERKSELTLPAPIGRVLVSTLCALAAGGHEVKRVDQASDGCALHTVIPSSLWALSGELLVSVHAKGRGTRLEASTLIGGQMFDWGHSQRILNALFDSIRKELLAPSSPSARRLAA